MTDDHHGRTAGRATLLVRAVDEILGTHMPTPVASQVPSGEIATASTDPVWPVRVARRVPSAAQIRAIPSKLAVASQVPSGEIATAHQPSVTD